MSSLWEILTTPPKCVECGTPITAKTAFKVGKKLLCYGCAFPQPKPSKAPPTMNDSVSGWNELISPRTFNDYIGQEPIKKELQTMIKASNLHGIPVQHVLFSGSFGLGKTTIAKIFGGSIGKAEVVTAFNLKDAGSLPSSSVVVVDEIHTLRDEEWLLEVMDKGKKTILAATTTAGSLSGPLRSRFVSLVLQPYTKEELKRMIKGAAKNLGYNCPDYVAEEVAARGKTVARIALFLFKRVYDRVILNGSVTPESLAEWFGDMAIDPDGLDNADRAYINCLSNRPIGLQNLSAMTGLDRITLEETIEPYLLTAGYVVRTPRGRIKGDRKPVEIW